MQKLFIRVLCLALILPMLLLSGCSDFDEMKSKRPLKQAEALLEEGRESQAEEAFNQLITAYPATPSAEVARRHLQQLQAQREKRERAAFGTILDSYRQVLNGYRSLHAQYPVSLAVLDASGYFFDSSYFEEITPQGYQVYLWLYEDGSGYRVWCAAEEGSRIYGIESKSNETMAFDRQELMEKVTSRFQEVFRSDKLVVLQMRN